MKKIACFLLFFILLATASCSNETKNESQKTEYGEEIYAVTEPFWFIYSTPQRVIDESDLIASCKITDISFKMLDATTGFEPTEDTDKGDIEMYTIYDIEALTSYKGDIEKAQMVIGCGIKDYRVEEQLSILNEYGQNYITIWNDEYEKLEVGATYLFALKQVFHYLIPLNPFQSFHSLENPFINNYNKVSAHDIVSCLGEEKWDLFWDKWQTDNPNWETWIDRNVVAEALNIE